MGFIYFILASISLRLVRLPVAGEVWECPGDVNPFHNKWDLDIIDVKDGWVQFSYAISRNQDDRTQHERRIPAFLWFYRPKSVK
jgi:hypothetical protein